MGSKGTAVSATVYAHSSVVVCLVGGKIRDTLTFAVVRDIHGKGKLGPR